MRRCILWFGLFSPAAPASLFIVVYLFLFLPVTSWMRNPFFFSHGFSAVLPVLLLLAAPVYVLLALPAAGGHKQWHKYYAAVITGVALTAFAYSLLMSSEHITNNRFFWALFIAFIVLGYYKAEFLKWVFVLTSVCFLLIVMVVAFLNHKQGYLDYQEAKIELGAFSKNKNMLVILLDAFQSDFFQEILAKKPAWTSEFSGFTYFPNATSVGPLTYLSIPTIHTGRMYQPGESVTRFYQEEVEKKSFLKELQEHGYRAMMLNPYMGFTPPHVARIDENYFSSIQSGAAHDACLLLNLSFSNSLPFLAYWWSKILPLTSTNGMLSELASNITTDSSVPTAKFLHLYDSHAPAKHDENCKLIETPVWTRATAVNQDQCAVSNVIKLLRALKQHDLYNQTAIVIMGDHGAGFPPDMKESSLGAYANPILLVKPFNMNGALKSAPQRISVMDVKKIVCALTNDCSTKQVDLEKLISSFDTSRHLPFNLYRADNAYTDVVRVFPYELKGSPRENASWLKIIPPQSHLNQLSFMYDSFQDYAGIGWGPAETGELKGRWAIGPEADFFLPLAQGKDINIAFSASILDKIQDQELSIWVNDHFIAKYPIVAQKYNRITFQIPKKLITSQPTHVVFRFKHVIPAGEDGTLVAAMFFGTMLIDTPFFEGVQPLPSK